MATDFNRLKKETDINLSGIHELKTVDTYEKANELLLQGWILIDIAKHELRHDNGSVTTIVDYILGKLNTIH